MPVGELCQRTPAVEHSPDSELPEYVGCSPQMIHIRMRKNEQVNFPRAILGQEPGYYRPCRRRTGVEKGPVAPFRAKYSRVSLPYMQERRSVRYDNLLYSRGVSDILCRI